MCVCVRMSMYVRTYVRMYVSIKHFLYPFICQWTLMLFLCFYVFAVVNNAAVNMKVQISLRDGDFTSIRCIPGSRIAQSYDSSIFNFLKNLHIVLHSGCTNLHSHQECMRLPFSPHPHQQLFSLVFLIIGILTGVR